MSGKLVSLFDHPEFMRRAQARAERELVERVVPVIDLGRGRFRCRRCSLDFDADAVAPLNSTASARPLTSCPDCDPPEFDAIEAFLAEILEDA
jgi:hypothetical protein